MKKGIDKHKLKAIRKKNSFNNWLFLCIRFVLFSVGIIALLFFKPEIAINARYLQQPIDNGGATCIAIFVLLSCSIYRFLNKVKNIRYTLDIENNSL